MNNADDIRVAAVEGPPWQRRAFHAAVGSAIPTVAFFVPEPLAISALAILAASSVALDLVRFRVASLNQLFLKWFRLLLKSNEDQRITGATFLLIGACISFLIFDREVALAVLLFLSLGDPAAALVGRPMPGPRFFGKSPFGTLAFIGTSLLILALLVFTGTVSFRWALVGGAVVAGLVELAPIPLDDNLTVPLITGSAVQFLPQIAANLASG